MSSPTRRALTIDDPVAAAAACHVAHPADRRGRRPPAGDPAGRDPSQPDAAAQALRSRRRSPRWLTRSASAACCSRSSSQPRSAGGYELIAGERRWRASHIAGRPTIPALVGDDGRRRGLARARADRERRPRRPDRDRGSPHDRRRSWTTWTSPRALLARRLGRSRSDLAHTVRLLDLPDEAIELLDNGALTKGHGKGAAHRARPPSPARTRRARSRRRVVSSRARSRDRASITAPTVARPTRIPITSPPPPSSTSSSLGQPGATSRHARTASGISSSSTRTPPTGLPSSFNPPQEPINDAVRTRAPRLVSR